MYESHTMTRSAFSDDYIVRVYRYNKSNSRCFAGTVEKVGMEGKQAFSNLEELWKILMKTKKTEEPEGRA